jgi:hypothetical protein
LIGATAFDTVWVEGLFHKLTILNFPSYLVKTLSSSPQVPNVLQISHIHTRRTMRVGVAQGGLVSPVLFSLYVNDMLTPSRHVELALYADDTALIATSCSPLLLVRYLKSLISIDWSSDYGIGGKLSTFRRAPQCCLPRPRDASKDPGHPSLSESQYNELKQHSTLV